MRSALRLVVGIYALLGLLSLLLIPASAHGWFGVASDPLSAVFALALALPWTVLLFALPPMPTWLSFMLLALGMTLNVVAGMLLVRRMRAG
ncbi:hypothetical protein [Variovorax rhizosphaerae]|uniref:DUF1049 domain-containing protein n=1 Tax=Variovorax rhizosphaerae TaxID=1836200 RepID=A0ABU8WG65_9BURK